VVEAVYPSLHEAVSDRLTMRFGAWASILTPLLTLQVGSSYGRSRTRDMSTFMVITAKSTSGAWEHFWNDASEVRPIHDGAEG
jgi:hypothetical protein